jgi:hypothetical protein
MILQLCQRIDYLYVNVFILHQWAYRVWKLNLHLPFEFWLLRLYCTYILKWPNNNTFIQMSYRWRYYKFSIPSNGGFDHLMWVLSYLLSSKWWFILMHENNETWAYIRGFNLGLINVVMFITRQSIYNWR